MKKNLFEKIIVQNFQQAEYEPIYKAMQEFTAKRGPTDLDEIWLIEHPSVFTLGRAARLEHIKNPKNISVIQTDRGGQVTYHGPGQLMLYTLIDLQRRGLMPRQFVSILEQTVIDLLAEFEVKATRKPHAPGVYLETSKALVGPKIAAVGLRISRGASYHGLALNVAMDLSPFDLIDPCGTPGLKTTDLQRNLNFPVAIEKIAQQLSKKLISTLLNQKNAQDSPKENSH